MGKITLKDIADATGFSVAKVSRAINDTGAINESDRNIILQKAADLGYDCKLKKVNDVKIQIAIVVPRFDSFQTSTFIQKLNDRLLSEKYGIDYYTVAGSDKEESELLQEIIDKEYNIIIYKPLRVNEKVQRVINSCNIPVFSFGQVYGNCININYDNFQLMYDITTVAVKEEKCKRLLYIGTYKIDIEVGVKRFEGFLKSVSDNGVAYQYQECICDIDSAFDLCSVIDLDAYDAILCATDNLALGVHRALIDRKITPGKDVKLSGVGNNKVGRVVTPSLTTVELDKHEVVEIILARLKNNDFSPTNYIVPYKLVRRESL